MDAVTFAHVSKRFGTVQALTDLCIAMSNER